MKYFEVNGKSSTTYQYQWYAMEILCDQVESKHNKDKVKMNKKPTIEKINEIKFQTGQRREEEYKRGDLKRDSEN